MVISHSHFHRAIFGGSYAEILKALCTKNNIPYVLPLKETPDSNAIIQKLSEKCQEFKGNISSETGSEISNSEDEESNSERDSENDESPKEENQFLKRKTRATPRAKRP